MKFQVVLYYVALKANSNLIDNLYSLKLPSFQRGNEKKESEEDQANRIRGMQ